ncbi:MAG: hypothetical protein K2X44_04860, partial [Magnetospirillum sp.]|nr:hypothetical protein [Magnetospirillum sp.]
MRILLILPPSALEAPDTARAMAAARNRFAQYGQVWAAADEVQAGAVAAALDQTAILPWPSHERFDVLVFVDGYGGESHLAGWRAQDGGGE